MKPDIRGYVTIALQDAPIPECPPGCEPPAENAKGVLSFYKSWFVSGGWEHGLMALYSDSDDLIEFGLTQRVHGEPTNILMAQLDLPENSLTVSSDTNGDMNFTVLSVDQQLDALRRMLTFFVAQLLQPQSLRAEE